MKLENYEFSVGKEKVNVLHCKGDGQCVCSSCKTPKWTSWFYKLSEEDKGVLCSDCMREVLIKRRIEKEIKQFVFLIESCLVYHNDDDTLTKKEILELLYEILYEEYKIKTLK